LRSVVDRSASFRSGAIWKKRNIVPPLGGASGQGGPSIGSANTTLFAGTLSVRQKLM